MDKPQLVEMGEVILLVAADVIRSEKDYDEWIFRVIETYCNVFQLEEFSEEFNEMANSQIQSLKLMVTSFEEDSVDIGWNYIQPLGNQIEEKVGAVLRNHHSKFHFSKFLSQFIRGFVETSSYDARIRATLRSVTSSLNIPWTIVTEKEIELALENSSFMETDHNSTQVFFFDFPQLLLSFSSILFDLF